MKKRKILNVLLGIILWVLSLIVFIPLLLIIINSFKSSAEAYSMSLELPGVFHLENYEEVLRTGRLGKSFLNSLLITGCSVFFSCFLGTMAGYVLERRRDKINRTAYRFFLLGLVVPVQIITLIEVLKTVNLMNTYLGIISVYIAMFVPLSSFMAYGFSSSLPRELDEAAVVDGASPWQMYFRVMYPLLSPVFVTSVVTQCVFIWNDFQYPLYILTNSRKWTMVLGVYNFLGQYSSSWNLVCAYILVCSFPIFLVYLFGQKYIIDGMVAGAVKG